MDNWHSLADIRREYGDLRLSLVESADSPMEQFMNWFADSLNSANHDPTAMVLSTVDADGFPDSRVVLLKGIDNGQFEFYTNYESTKAKQLAANPNVALNFYWPQMARQVRLRGKVCKLSAEKSDDYFVSRPKSSQISAIASPQSSEISSREELDAFVAREVRKKQEIIMRPEYWGGYQVEPQEVEFWQGRDNRLHDRIRYLLTNGKWEKARLAP